MAVDLGMHPTTLRRYMNGESDITLSMLDHIAAGLGVHPDELMRAGEHEIQPAHELVRTCLDILRGLDERDLPRVVQMLAAYASPTKGRLEKPSSAVDLDALTVPHRASTEGRVREGVARSGTGQHSKQRRR
nr:helix-turn-helix transcriptional regulator [Cupriavidus plantarum]